MTQCLIAPFAALIEWRWLGNKLTFSEILCVAVILIGVAIALKPDDHLKISRRDRNIGMLACVLAALAGALSAVLIRKAFAVAVGEWVSSRRRHYGLPARARRHVDPHGHRAHF